MDLRILRTWDGVPVRPDEEVVLKVDAAGDGLFLEIDAPFHADPPPAAPAGSTDRLWEHEVVELFLLGEDERYTEIELGPHGHWWALRLSGVRTPVESGLLLEYKARIAGARWSGRARVPWGLLPEPVTRLNAYAIHGVATRRYLAWSPVPGDVPDFHRIHLFPTLPIPLRRP